MIRLFKSGIKLGSGQTDTNGLKTIVREMIFSYDDGDTDADLLSSEYYPLRNSSLPDYPAFKLESIGTPEWSEVPQHIRVEATYKTRSSLDQTSGSGADVKPWDLGATGLRITFRTEEASIIYGFDYNGEIIELRNYAGCLFDVTATRVNHTIEFSKSYKYTGRSNIRNYDIVYNQGAVRLFGISYPDATLKMYPPSSEVFTEYDENGEIDYQYETLNYVIEVNYGSLNKRTQKWSGWYKNIPQVGTLALFEVNGERTLGAIFKYFPYTSADESAQAAVQPLFGGIQDVLKANARYQKLIGDDTKNIPFEEFTEPMPLNEDGSLWQEAIKDPKNNPYKVLQYIDRKPVSFSGFNLPKNLGD